MKKEFTNATWSKMVDTYERAMEPFVTRWAEDALQLAHERMLGAVQARLSSSTSADETPLPSALTFVDVGCGTGALCLAFAEKYLSASAPASAASSALAPTTTDATTAMQSIQIVATDIADGMLARLDEKLETRTRYQRFRNHITTVQMDGQLLNKLADNSVDIIGSNFGLSIFPDRNLAWRSAARVLRDGGVLFATVWDAQSPNLRWADATVSLTREIELEQAADKTGGSGSGGEEVDSPTDKPSPPPLFVPSLRVGHGDIENELTAVGFRTVEMHCTQHSIDVSSEFVDALFSSPVFIERVGRDRHAQLLRSFMESEAAKQPSVAQTNGPSDEAGQLSGLPTMLSFVGHTLIAIK